jgi:protein ImuA
MSLSKQDIIQQLQKEIHLMQGFKSTTDNNKLNRKLGPVRYSFPGDAFPLAAIHEFISQSDEATAATTGFISGLLAELMQNGGACIWLNAGKTLFPPAFSLYGIEPANIIFIELQKEKDLLWAMEEALKCNGLAAVIGEIKELNFNASRRLQLAVEQSRVTGFVLRRNPRSLNTTACVTRWKITPVKSELPAQMPGIGFPRWNVELQKVRNGKAGQWEIEYAAGMFRHIAKRAALPMEQQRKTG